MKKTILVTALSCAVAGVSFAAQNLTPTEQVFVQKAAKSDEAEMTLSKLALERSTNPGVKQFAQEMITDHTKSTSMLKPIAMSHGVTLPDNPGPANSAKVKQLSKKKGTEFDSAYLDLMVSDHQDTLQAFDTAKPGLKDPKLKEFAATVQPIVAHHLEMAKQMHQGKMPMSKAM